MVSDVPFVLKDKRGCRHSYGTVCTQCAQKVWILQALLYTVYFLAFCNGNECIYG